MPYEVVYPNCISCSESVRIWSSGVISDAYQKDGSNHYTFYCPNCGTKQMFSIPIDDSDQSEI